MGLLMALPRLWLLFAAHVGSGGVGFEEDVGGFFEEVFVGWADWRGDAGGEFQDVDGSAEGGSLGTTGEMALNDIECGSGHGAETIGVIEPEGLALTIE